MQDAIRFLDDIIFNLKLERFEGEKPLQLIAEKLKTHPKQVLRGAVGGVLSIGLLVLLFLASDLVYLALSVVYPAYSTARALSSQDFYSKEGKLWLSYWIIYALLAIVTGLFGFVLNIIPLFGTIQSIFILWLYNRKTRGAEFLVSGFIQPLVRQYASLVDSHLNSAAAAVAPKTE